ncbi:MAG: DUF559 domain-containing protein [Actinobacteria bacterium]|nr:DUF559 domain-containing protein [Actinomycetota bacterium]
MTRAQLMGLGLSRRGVQHRIARGRLHLIGRGIYAVGMAALSHSSAAALFKIGTEDRSSIEVTRLAPGPIRIPGVRVHRCPRLGAGWHGLCEGIPVTSPVQTLIDLATRYERGPMERAINEADKLGLVRTDVLRRALDDHKGKPGVGRLRAILDRRTFAYTRSELERVFIPLARQAGLPKPRTSVYLNGHEVDFHFPDLELVVETDGLTYHRTPAQQAKDAERDQDHTAAGLTPLRFTHGQIKYEPERVVRILRAAGDDRAAPRRLFA